MGRPNNPNDSSSGANRSSDLKNLLTPPGTGKQSTGPKTLKQALTPPGTKGSRNPSKTTRQKPAYAQFPYLRPPTGDQSGYKYQNVWKSQYIPKLYPVTMPRRNGRATMVNNGLARGSIWASRITTTNDTSVDTHYGQFDYWFHFFYNPTEIHYSNALFTEALPPSSLNADSYFTQAFPATESLSFSILLDRTEEAYHEVNSPGTLQDLYVLYGVINGGAPKEGYDLGYLYLTPVQINFGFIGNPHYQDGPHLVYDNPYTFTGYITNLQISHQRFSERMVPNITTVDFTVTKITQVQPKTPTPTNGG